MTCISPGVLLNQYEIDVFVVTFHTPIYFNPAFVSEFLSFPLLTPKNTARMLLFCFLFA